MRKAKKSTWYIEKLILYLFKTDEATRVRLWNDIQKHAFEDEQEPVVGDFYADCLMKELENVIGVKAYELLEKQREQQAYNNSYDCTNNSKHDPLRPFMIFLMSFFFSSLSHAFLRLLDLI